MKRRATTQSSKQCSIACSDCGLKFTDWDVFKTHLHQHALEEEEEEEEKEEEEVAQMGDNMNPAAELDSGRADDEENRGGDTGGDADGRDISSSLQTSPSGSMTKQAGKIHTCSVCGKVYTYFVSFIKHQQLHEKEAVPAKSPELSEQNLRKYQCPDCGMSFIRRTRLLGHLRVHRSKKSKTPRCDQCNKDFVTVKTWMAHMDLHKQKPFWCSSCARGFKEKELLNKHLLSHSQKVYMCNICHKTFSMSNQLRIHYNSHIGAKPYQCTVCGKGFSEVGNLISHRKKHLRVYVGSSGMPRGLKSSAIMAKNRAIIRQRLLARVKQEMGANMEELSDDTDESEDDEYSEESECGEPDVDLSRPSSSAGSDPPDGLKSGPLQQQELDENESDETDVSREHLEWECVECDMSFDEVEKLHLHYIKHATGELPIPQWDI